MGTCTKMMMTSACMLCANVISSWTVRVRKRYLNGQQISENDREKTMWTNKIQRQFIIKLCASVRFELTTTLGLAQLDFALDHLTNLIYCKTIEKGYADNKMKRQLIIK